MRGKEKDIKLAKTKSKNGERPGSQDQDMNSEEAPVMPVERFLSWMHPKISRRLLLLQQRKKKRKETSLFIAGYIVFIFITGATVFDYYINGLANQVSGYLYFIGIFSIGLIVCIPLLLKFKKVV